ncbi:hypothetical protein NDU88_002155 [Pleurodeles waltl]|uniref:Uncharacterized protein n=1 Tax=Pleurodeles waltl TaxID=8319 RepID=A0AAV7LBI2_PLEWA|nr:hypothetical protein NDU88_002155 [Pleurodeles waltl]
MAKAVNENVLNGGLFVTSVEGVVINRIAAVFVNGSAAVNGSVDCGFVTNRSPIVDVVGSEMDVIFSVAVLGD